MATGIYCIENIINNKKYIGQSKDIFKRWKEHSRHLDNNKHPNTHLQNAWNRYGKKQFVFYILEICENKILPQQEIYWIDILKTSVDDNGYNLTYGGEGGNLTNEVKKKIGNANRGKIHTKEQNEQHSKAIKGKLAGKKHPMYGVHKYGKDAPMYGKHHTEETKRKIGDANRNRIWTEEQKEKLKGRVVSEETRKKISESNKGRKTTNETKEKLRKKHTGKKMSDEARRKMSEAKKGHIPWNKGIKMNNKKDVV